MATDGNLGTRVGHLETSVAEIKATLTGFSGVLGEIKASLNNSRPAWYVLAPIAITFILMIAAGVAAFGSVKGELAGLHALKDARDSQFGAIDHRLEVL